MFLWENYADIRRRLADSESRSKINHKDRSDRRSAIVLLSPVTVWSFAATAKPRFITVHLSAIDAKYKKAPS
jgi:hypothetical protein